MATKLLDLRTILFLLCSAMIYFLFNIWRRSDVEKKIESAVMEDFSDHRQNELPSLNEQIYPNYNVHIFYYFWSVHPIDDMRFLTWLDKNTPADTDGARMRYDRQYVVTNFYPLDGPYNSNENLIMNYHMKQLRKIGIGVLVISWRPYGKTAEQKDVYNSILKSLFETADRYNLKISLHLEVPTIKDISTLKKYMKEFMQEFGSKNSLYRLPREGGRLLPVYYVYYSYLNSPYTWHALLGQKNTSEPDNMSIRSTELDAIFIGLCVDLKDVDKLKLGGFDGFYTYFGLDGLTFCSSPSNWEKLSELAKKYNMLFIPSVAPGYSAYKAKDWGQKKFKNRKNGMIYERFFSKAVKLGATVISVNSFNHWKDGTQIDEAIPMKLNKFKYMDYLPNNPDYYLRLTKKWVKQFNKASSSPVNKSTN